MKTICRRLQKLEQVFVPAVVPGDVWGSMAGVRDKLLRLSEPQGSEAVAQFRRELDELGPTGLWRETVRCHLRGHGIVQGANESLADMTSRALGINNQELTAHFEHGTIGKALLERFASAE